MAYFYRRPNGVYYARVRVPDALRAVYGSPDLRRTLNTSDHSTAQRLALMAAFEWKSEFERIYSMLDAKKLAAGSPILLSGGLISLDEAADAVGLTTAQLFTEARARGRRVRLRLVADGWMGVDVPRSELVQDALSSKRKTLIVDVGEALLGRELVPVLGTLFIRPNALMLVSGGVFTDCLFFRDPALTQAVVTDLPGVSVPVGTLLIQRTDAEAIRADLAKSVTPEMLTAGDGGGVGAGIGAISEVVEKAVMGAAFKHKGTKTSAMLAQFYQAKVWSPSTAEQNKRMCGMFVELMNDPLMVELDRDLIARYRERLQALPADLRNVKAKNKRLTLDQLIDLGDSSGLDKLPRVRADRYIAKIGEALAWATENQFININPAANQSPKAKKNKKAQDDRQQFDDKTLALIFGQSWYQSGKGEKASTGKYFHFQPFNYWMPLLALFTGGRLNELAQLYLKDIRQTESGLWLIDFNLEGEGKIDADSSIPQKQLKTVNSQRVIVMHSELVRMGLPEYVKALKGAGHVRLFPELNHDRLKGYGKYAGQWFNERLLGKKLGIERDGTRTFHSFRHTFITACDRLSMPDRLKNELSGHERGIGQREKTYTKDRTAEEQAPFLSPLKFTLPEVAPFNIVEGVKAVHDALERKSRPKSAKSGRVGMPPKAAS
jgi:integrase